MSRIICTKCQAHIETPEQFAAHSRTCGAVESPDAPGDRIASGFVEGFKEGWVNPLLPGEGKEILSQLLVVGLLLAIVFCVVAPVLGIPMIAVWALIRLGMAVSRK